MNVPSGVRLGREVAMLLLAIVVTGGCASVPDGQAARASDSDDQVRVGYGTQDRSEVTGSVGSVTAEDLAGQQVTRLEDLIAGRFAGVYVERLPSGGISIRIRGASSFTGDTEPLYVIDGTPIHAAPASALAALDPNQIARIDILKDAGAAAIYGSRGANGVVVITTKRAR